MAEWLGDPHLLLLCRLLLGGVFLIAALAKLSRSLEFRQLLRERFRFPEPMVRLGATTLPWIELGVAIALFFGLWTKGAAAAAGGLLLFFSFLLARARLAGQSKLDCGCFGPGARARDPLWLAGRNILLLALAVPLLNSRGVSLPPESVLPTAFLAAAAFALPALLQGIRRVAEMRRSWEEFRLQFHRGGGTQP